MSAQPQSNENSPEAPAGARHANRVLVAVGILALLALSVLGYWFFFMRGLVTSDDARFNGQLVDLAPEIGGTLNDVLVREGERISRGQCAFRLDSSILMATLAQRQAAVASAEATLAMAQAQMDRAVHGPRPEEIKAAEAMMRKLQSEEELAQKEQQRMQKLADGGAGTVEQLERATGAYDAAKQARLNAAQTLAILQQGTRAEDIEAAKAAVAAAKAKLTEAIAQAACAKLDVARSSVLSPFDGFVVRRWHDPGSMVQPAQPVLSVFDPASLRVDANIEEKFLHKVAVGDAVDITADAYPGLHLKGRVAQILRAANSQYSLVPAEGVSGTYIKVTQRVPLRIELETKPEQPLGPGLSAYVRVHVGSAPAEMKSVAHE